jgi:hypothetical protein
MEGRGETGKLAADDKVDLALSVFEFQVVRSFVPSPAIPNVGDIRRHDAEVLGVVD